MAGQKEPTTAGLQEDRAAALEGPERSTPKLSRQAPLVREAAVDGDRTRQRPVAPPPGAAAADHLNLLDRLRRDGTPIDPAAEGIIDRHAVHQDQRPPGPVRAQRPRGDALGRRVRGKARGAAEQADPGDLAQHLVEPALRSAA